MKILADDRIAGAVDDRGKPGARIRSIDPPNAGRGRFQRLRGRNGGKNFEAKMGFLQAMVEHAAAARRLGRSIILCGDMNVTRTEIDVHPRERNPRLVGQRPDERALFDRILTEGNLRDVGRELDPNNEELFTWWAPWRQMRERNIGWRLDYLLASASLAARAVSCVSRRDVGTSDHGPVVAVFAPSAA